MAITVGNEKIRHGLVVPGIVVRSVPSWVAADADGLGVVPFGRGEEDLLESCMESNGLKYEIYIDHFDTGMHGNSNTSTVSNYKVQLKYQNTTFFQKSANFRCKGFFKNWSFEAFSRFWSISKNDTKRVFTCQVSLSSVWEIPSKNSTRPGYTLSCFSLLSLVGFGRMQNCCSCLPC